jgi:hypothetical protein
MQKLYSKEAIGSHGTFKMEINVDASKLPNLDVESIRYAAHDAADLIEQAVMAEVIKNDPQAVQNAADQKADLLGLFPSPIYVEEIPNGYCSQWCCKLLSWFIVTTHVGRIKIGWRKRVILIDWSETQKTKTSEELFAAENVTKDKRMIHAWNLTDARRYIGAILA